MNERDAFMAGYEAGRKYAKHAKKTMKKKAEDKVTCPPKSISDFKKVDESEFYAIQPYGDFNDIGDCYVYMDGYGYSYWVYELCDEASDNYGVWCYSIDVDGEADFWYPAYAVEEPFATKEEALEHMLEQVPLLYDNITDERLASKAAKHAKKATKKKATVSTEEFDWWYNNIDRNTLDCYEEQLAIIEEKLGIAPNEGRYSGRWHYDQSSKAGDAYQEADDETQQLITDIMELVRLGH